jgi:hypothetical protein
MFPARTPHATPSAPGEGDTNWIQRLLSGEDGSYEVPPEVIQRWLESGHTNAAELLAARQAGGGVEYLRKALAEFPNDPRVLQAAAGSEKDPAARRELLDRLKAADPGNALADYLSARSHFKAGQPEEALADMAAAGAKTRFDDYVVDAMQNAEDLYLYAGRSPAEATALGVSTVMLPHLAQLKGLAQDLAALGKEYVAAGDTASAQRLAQMGMQLGQELLEGDGSRCLINQLVGMAVENISLTPLDPGQAATSCPSPWANNWPRSKRAGAKSRRGRSSSTPG